MYWRRPTMSSAKSLYKWIRGLRYICSTYRLTLNVIALPIWNIRYNSISKSTVPNYSKHSLFSLIRCYQTYHNNNLRAPYQFSRLPVRLQTADYTEVGTGGVGGGGSRPPAVNRRSLKALINRKWIATCKYLHAQKYPP